MFVFPGCPSNAHVNSILSNPYSQSWDVSGLQSAKSPGYGCENSYKYWGYSHPGDGIIGTWLYGSGKARLTFGNCFQGGLVSAYLNGKQIGNSQGAFQQSSVEFDFTDGAVLQIMEKDGILALKSFEIIKCNQCAEGQIGDTCDSCKDDYFGFPTCQGELKMIFTHQAFLENTYVSLITACNCDAKGSVDTRCDSSGLCNCKDRFGGDRCEKCSDFYDGPSCDRCLPNYYGFSDCTCKIFTM